MAGWLRRILVFGLCFIVAMAALDLYLQFAEVESPMEDHLDHNIGLMYLPNFRFTRFSEGFFLGWTNAYGCLGKGAPQARDGHTIRIIFLGDSFPLGHTVFERHHFARSIESIVSERTGRPVEVLNFARADFALTNEYQHFRDFASRWNPDLALFFVDQTDLDPERQASGSFYPTASVEADTLRYEYSFSTCRKALTFEKYAPVLNRSVFPNLFFELLKRRGQGQLEHLVFDKFRPLRPTSGYPLDDPTGGRPTRPMPELTHLVLEKLARTPHVAVVLSGPTRPEYADIIRSLGIPVLDLNPVFADLKARGIDPYYWPVTRQRGHWNHQTHQAIGASLGEGVVPLLEELARRDERM